MLHDIESLVQQQGPLTAPMIARQLKSSLPAVEGMLNLLVARGRLRKVSQGACEGSCCGSAEGVELYQWQGDQALPLTTQLD